MCSRCVLLVRFVDVWDALMDRKGAVQLYHLVGVTGDTCDAKKSYRTLMVV